MADKGPGMSAPDPTAAHVAFSKLNWATLAAVLSESAMDPAAIRVAWSFYATQNIVSLQMIKESVAAHTPAYTTWATSP